MLKKLLGPVLLFGLAWILLWINWERNEALNKIQKEMSPALIPKANLHPMAVETLRQRNYPGSEIKTEETLTSGSNYARFIASYMSDGNKIYGLLTVPKANKPPEGFPIIVFVHGYIAPSEYKTTERYVAYQDGLAKNGFITYKIDLRGHGNSEGEAVNGHFSEAYVVDTLNAISSLKQLPQANKDKIGIWGHSNGGEIGLRAMVVSEEIDAGVFWAGVVGSAQGMLETYNSKIPFLSEERLNNDFIKEFKYPSQNREFWSQVDPYYHLENIKGAIQLHHGTNDKSVPIETSLELKANLDKLNKEVEMFEYQGADHNLGGAAFSPAMTRSVEFFKENL